MDAQELADFPAVLFGAPIVNNLNPRVPGAHSFKMRPSLNFRVFIRMELLRLARFLQLVVAEVVMAAIEQPPLASTYSVEVSGWDHSHTFFVERSELTWSEDTGKLLILSRRLPPGAMVFVRLLQPADGDRAFPVAYETEALSDASERAQLFRITRVVPRCVPAENA